VTTNDPIRAWIAVQDDETCSVTITFESGTEDYRTVRTMDELGDLVDEYGILSPEIVFAKGAFIQLRNA
jgi:hypothetical protein